VFVDSHRIVQVLVNLLGNSIKYSPDYGHIIVEGKATRNSFLIQVIDNGYGVPEWAQKKIFDKFFQADIIMSQKVGGTGLGLNISKRIVEDHGGSIECISPVDQSKYPELPIGNERKGAIINISLPLA
jgi:signal transduction histidine kinase